MGKVIKAENYHVAINLAPQELEAFKKWHPLACKNDPMKVEDRFKQLANARKAADKK